MNDEYFRNRIDDYKDSVFAIIGFVNLFRFDDVSGTIKEVIKVFQGRRMKTSPTNRISPNDEVTPDFCIQDSSDKGIIGEVKKNFPKNRELWIDDFRQLMSYDDDLINWLTLSSKIDDHEIVLISHSSRSRALIRFFLEHKDKDVTFIKNFIIMEFYRNDQRDSYYAFRKEHGSFRYFSEIDERLEEGIQVPLSKLMLTYEKVKLYDSEPPLPYLLHLIWESVIMLRASTDVRFAGLRRNSKLPIDITVDEIVDELYENYSFKKVNADNSLHQPKIPLKSWIKKSVNAFISFGLAKWKNEPAGECTIYFKKFKDTLRAFIDSCIEHKLDIDTDEKQMELFDKKRE